MWYLLNSTRPTALGQLKGGQVSSQACGLQVLRLSQWTVPEFCPSTRTAVVIVYNALGSICSIHMSMLTYKWKCRLCCWTTWVPVTGRIQITHVLELLFQLLHPWNAAHWLQPFCCLSQALMGQEFGIGLAKQPSCHEQKWVLGC